jgi:protein-S-isoprenylcysteine O-methyltransferase Ste14
MFQFANYPSPVYSIAFSISFWSWLLFEIWVFSRDRGKGRRDAHGNGRWVLLALAIGIIVGLNMPAVAPMLNIQGSVTACFIFGIGLMWAGILFRFCSIQTLGKYFSTRLVIQERHELITTGPYRYLRNPSYTGALVTFLGMGLAAANWLSAIILLFTGLISYVWRIKVEDRMLLEQFGRTYEDYKRRTWALIPFVW